MSANGAPRAERRPTMLRTHPATRPRRRIALLASLKSDVFTSRVGR